MPPELFWFLIVALTVLAVGSMIEQRRNDRETEQALFELGRRVSLLEAQSFVLPPAPEPERLILPPPFPLPPVPRLPLQSRLTRQLTRVWRRG